MLLAILEDDLRRLAEMHAVLAEEFPAVEVYTAPDAHVFIAWLALNLPRVSLLCLDHDLVLPARRPGEDRPADPGDGRDVVRWLLDQPLKVPVLVHTSNARAGESMEGDLLAAGWSAFWTIPHDDVAWIRGRWIKRVAERIATGAR